MTMLNAIVALCLFGGAYAELSSANTCPNVETVANFDISRYAGRWYEAEKLLKVSEIGASCIPTDFSPNADGTFQMINLWKDASGIQQSVEVIARIPDATQPGKLEIRDPRLPAGFESDYLVLGTDYQNYAVVYNCKSTKIGNTRRAWILTREKNPSEAVIAEAISVAERNQLSQSDFIQTEHTNCNAL